MVCIRTTLFQSTTQSVTSCIHAHIHTATLYAAPLSDTVDTAIKGQYGVPYLVRGHFRMQTAGAGLLISVQQIPPEPQPPPGVNNTTATFPAVSLCGAKHYFKAKNDKPAGDL